MTTLKSVLEKDLSKKTKAELIDMLSGLEKTLSPSVYEKVSGVATAELGDLSKKEVLDIVAAFNSKYDANWEKSFEKASNAVMNMVAGISAADSAALFKTADAADANFAAELGSIDFAKIIGGPLDACVKAQTNASVSTVSFINEVGFEPKLDAGGDPLLDADGKQIQTLRMSDFSYTKTVKNPKYDAADPDNDEEEYIDQKTVVQVPFIALLNVPSFRIESCDVDFNVKLNSTFTQKTDTEFGINTSVSGGVNSLFAKVNFKVDVAYKRTSSTGIKVEKEYSLGVKVRATNDEMPAGLEKVLGMLSA